MNTASSAAIKLMSVAEYFDFEDASVEKHEFYQGRIYPMAVQSMAGGTPRHSQVKVNLIGELRERLRGKPCKPYDSDLRISIVRNGLITYPDASVVCGKPEIDKQDRHAYTNPTVIFEVMSPSTEHYDRGSKFRLYKDLPSLREYVLVSQDEPVVEIFRRANGEGWLHSVSAGLKASAVIESIRIKLPLAALYEDITFDPPSNPGALFVLKPPAKKPGSRKKKTPR
jgi:Uma2 family endonuclease